MTPISRVVQAVVLSAWWRENTHDRLLPAFALFVAHTDTKKFDAMSDAGLVDRNSLIGRSAIVFCCCWSSRSLAFPSYGRPTHASGNQQITKSCRTTGKHSERRILDASDRVPGGRVTVCVEYPKILQIPGKKVSALGVDRQASNVPAEKTPERNCPIL